MVPTSFAEENIVLDKPPELTYDQCEAINAFRGHSTVGLPITITCWKPTRDELEEIQRTGRVWLLTYGFVVPPSIVLGLYPFER